MDDSKADASLGSTLGQPLALKAEPLPWTAQQVLKLRSNPGSLQPQPSHHMASLYATDVSN